MKTTYAKIDGSDYHKRFHVFTSTTRHGVYINTFEKFESEKQALEYCAKNNYEVIK